MAGWASWLKSRTILCKSIGWKGYMVGVGGVNCGGGHEGGWFCVKGSPQHRLKYSGMCDGKADLEV